MRRSVLTLLTLVTLFCVPTLAVAQTYPAAKTGGNYMHNYYLPPAASSSPWWPTWSPDGQWLAFAMDGSLWRMRITNGKPDGAGEELLREREFLSSPEWSPDGRWMAYTADADGKSINIRVLNLQSGETTAITTGAQVNVEPAWSPDGRRLAYVSTAPNGYFNVFVVDVANGKPGTQIQVTTDHKFGRERLYFSDVDVNLSPSWSPDGRELLIVSNRGIPLGSGGIWRMPVEADAMNNGKAVLLHKEETLFRTRPQWSIDGKRFIYVSHLGGQFTNLFVLPAVGGEPYKMTFGDYDSFLPRWSPDGEWIAYVSNEQGLPQLKLLKTWGGEARVVRVTQKKWKTPMGRLDVRVIDGTTGRETEARVYHTASDGKPYTPAGSYERLGPLSRHLFHTPGHYTTEAPPGPFTIEALRGFEYDIAKQTVEVKAGATTSVTVTLKRIADLRTKGWYSGSNHEHMNYAGNLHNTPENMMLMNAAEGANMISLQIANKDNRVLDVQIYKPGQAQHPLSTKDLVMHVGQEYRPPFYGHLSLFNLKEHLISPFVTGYEGTGVESLYPSNTDILRYAKEQGGIGSYVHPFFGATDPVLNLSLAGAKTLPVDAALGAVSYHELWSQSAADAGLMVWYKLLSSGFRIPVTGGEDSISSLHRVELVGSVRGYFNLGTGPNRLSWDNWMKALLAGRGFVTNGPLIEFSANQGVMPGDEITVPAAGGKVTFHGVLTSQADITKFELVGNGEVIHTVPMTASKRSANFDLPLTIGKSGWYSLRASGENGTFPVENTRPLAVSNPIYVIVGGQPIRDRVSSEYYVKWIDILSGMASEHPGWRSDKEKAHVLGQFKEAREIFVKRAAEAR